MGVMLLVVSNFIRINYCSPDGNEGGLIAAKGMNRKVLLVLLETPLPYSGESGAGVTPTKYRNFRYSAVLAFYILPCQSTRLSYMYIFFERDQSS